MNRKTKKKRRVKPPATDNTDQSAWNNYLANSGMKRIKPQKLICTSGRRLRQKK